MKIQKLSVSRSTFDGVVAAHARQGYGVPSQDPRPGAQQSLSPEEAAREARSVYVAGTAIGGAAVGATIGTVVVGPVGTFVGGIVGGLVGTVGGIAAGTGTIDPSEVPRVVEAARSFPNR